MTSARTGALLAAFLAGTGAESQAQSFVVVGAQRRVSPVGEYWQECSVGARVGNANEVVISPRSLAPAFTTPSAIPPGRPC